MLNIINHSVQFSSVAQSCLTLSDPMMPAVHHKPPEFTQTHAHQVGDAIQPSHPLSSPSPPAPNPSQHQGLFQWVNSSHEVAKLLEFQLQHKSFQWKPRTYLLQDGLVGSPCSPRDSQESQKTRDIWNSRKAKSNNKCWRQWEVKGTLLRYWWECKLVPPLWKTI